MRGGCGLDGSEVTLGRSFLWRERARSRMVGGMITDDEQAEIDRNSDARIVAVVTMLADLSDREREDAMERIRERFCVHCGADDPRCRCWDDE
jgi:hypothetical protein